jgi:cell division septation protein DedD
MASRLLSSLPVRPRTAIALGLLLLVALIVVVGKLLGGSEAPLGPNLGSIDSTVDPSAGNDSVAEIQPTPSPRQATDGQPATAVATTFAQNWLAKTRSAQAWLAALQPLATKTVGDELTGVDPVTVPAERITGEATSQVYADAVMDVSIPCDSGTLRLRMVFTQQGSNGKWLVDGIDWAPL